jgi:hypothetical protein
MITSMHRRTESDWPFQGPRNLAVFTIRQVIERERPILRVSHDVDGDWQFLDWPTPLESDARLLSLAEIVELDDSILDVADLPLGWKAVRRGPDEPWIRSPMT